MGVHVTWEDARADDPAFALALRVHREGDDRVTVMDAALHDARLAGLALVYDTDVPVGVVLVCHAARDGRPAGVYVNPDSRHLTLRENTRRHAGGTT